jgi:hypothetical protein
VHRGLHHALCLPLLGQVAAGAFDLDETGKEAGAQLGFDVQAIEFLLVCICLAELDVRRVFLLCIKRGVRSSIFEER